VLLAVPGTCGVGCGAQVGVRRAVWRARGGRGGVQVCCSAVAVAVVLVHVHGATSTMSREIDQMLCSAAVMGNVGQVERLIAAGANPNAFEGTRGNTPLLRAAIRGHVAVMAALLAAGAHVDGAASSGNTPLMLTIFEGHTAALKMLIAAGADVNRANTAGNTSLHWASMYGNLDAARILLEAGAKTGTRNKDGKHEVDVVRGCCDRHDDDRSLDVARACVCVGHMDRATPCVAVERCAGLGASRHHASRLARAVACGRCVGSPP